MSIVVVYNFSGTLLCVEFRQRYYIAPPIKRGAPILSIFWPY